MWFFDFPKNHRFQVFQNTRIKELAGSGYFLRITIKVPVSSGDFKTLQRPDSFQEKTDGSFPVFSRFFDFITFFLGQLWGRVTQKYYFLVGFWWWVPEINICCFGSGGEGFRKWEPPVLYITNLIARKEPTLPQRTAQH